MKLARKTTIYSLISMIVIFIVFFTYTSLLLPNLYADRATKEAKKEVKRIHQKFVEERNYRNIETKNWASTFSIEIMKEIPEVKVYRKEGEGRFKFKDPKIIALHKKFIDYNKEFSENSRKEDFKPFDESDLDFLKSIGNEKMDLKFISYEKKLSNSKDEQKIDIEPFGKNNLLLTMSYHDKNQEYVLEIGITDREDAIIITYVPIMIGSVNQILPVIWSSLPMVLAVLALIVFISSSFFAKSITNPIKTLAGNTKKIRNMEGMESSNIALKREDEIGELSRDIANMSKRLNEHYRGLKEENLRKEVLLRATSHQLKTPLSGALLLVDGLLDGIWEEEQKSIQIEKIKERLIVIQNMVERILRLEDKKELENNQIELRSLLIQIINQYQVQNPIEYEIKGESIWRTDSDLLERLLDNLISNVYNHGSSDGRMEIEIGEESISILNTKAHIPEDILPIIMEAFISKTEGKGRGLGLYLANYDAKRLGMRLEIMNSDDGVISILTRV
ncbi:MAG: HAMP domain-containing sensor histidine kinase [Andreesenia angusta]|nr:HAMP domain-containing sensor histidine kinase [Andreesenia angusta]